MSVKSELNKAIKVVGVTKLGRELGVAYQAITGWRDRNRMPDSEYSCRTNYAYQIEKLTDGKVTVESLLGFNPPCLKRD